MRRTLLFCRDYERYGTNTASLQSHSVMKEKLLIVTELRNQSDALIQTLLVPASGHYSNSLRYVARHLNDAAARGFKVLWPDRNQKRF